MFKRILNSVDLKTLAIGLSIVFAIYALIALYATISGKKYLDELQKNAPSQSVYIVSAQEKKSNPKHQIRQEEPSTHEEKVDISEFYTLSRDGLTIPAPRKSDGKTPFEQFSKKVENQNASEPKIAIIITDYGLSDDVSEEILKSAPDHSTFLLSQYSNNPEKWSKLARENGHELWLDVPMIDESEPNEASPIAIRQDMGISDGKLALYKILSKTKGYAGVVIDLDPATSEQSPLLKSLVDEIAARGLGIAQIHKIEKGQYDPVMIKASSLSMPYMQINASIKPSSLGELPDELDELRKLAEHGDGVVVTIPPWPSVVSRISKWSLDLKDNEELAIVPLSALSITNYKTEVKNANHQ